MSLIRITHGEQYVDVCVCLFVCLFVLKRNITRKYDSRRTSYTNNARIMNSRIIWRWNIAGIENSCIVPKTRKSDTLHSKIGARMGSFSCEDNKNDYFNQNFVYPHLKNEVKDKFNHGKWLKYFQFLSVHSDQFSRIYDHWLL